MAVTGINDDELGNYLFVSEDYGKDWKSISGNLPDEVAYVILEDPVNENILYAGLYRGVYISSDRGKTWSLLGPGMAAAAISDIVIQEREMDLIAGTHGRGIYKMNLRPIHEAYRNGSPRENILFTTPTARLPRINDSHGDPDLSTMENVPITFYLTHDARVTVRVTDNKDRTTWSNTIKAHKGFNQVRWDIVTKKSDSQQPFFYSLFQVYQTGELYPVGDRERHQSQGKTGGNHA